MWRPIPFYFTCFLKFLSQFAPNAFYDTAVIVVVVVVVAAVAVAASVLGNAR